MRRVHYHEGLNDFEYSASLHIFHPRIDPDDITQRLQMTPTRIHRPGDPRQTPKGTPLKGSYPSSYWTTDLQLRDDETLADFLNRLVDDLEPAKEFLRHIVIEEGEIECLIGLFAKGLCDNLLPATLLQRIGSLGINLRLDYYPDRTEPSG